MTDHDITAAQAHAAHLALNDRSADRLALLAEIDRLRGLVTALWQGGEALVDDGRRAYVANLRAAHWEAMCSFIVQCDEADRAEDGDHEAPGDMAKASRIRVAASKFAEEVGRTYRALQAMGEEP